MDLLIKLPKALVSKTNQDVPVFVLERLNYLWVTSCALASKTPDTAHRMSKAFIILSNNYDVDMPDYITNRICRHCCGIQIPTETCRMRLKVRSRNSRVNRKVPDGMKNQIVLRCTLCNKSSHKLPAYTVSDAARRAVSGSSQTASMPMDDPSALGKRSLSDMRQQLSSASLSAAGGPGRAATTAPAQKFSFLSKSAAPSSSSTSMSTVRGVKSEPNLQSLNSGKGKLEGDFVSFGKNNGAFGGNRGAAGIMHKSASSHSFSSTVLGKNSNNRPVASGTGKPLAKSSSSGSISNMASLLSSFNNSAVIPKLQPGLSAVNLLDLEKQNKKKRKSLGGGL